MREGRPEQNEEWLEYIACQLDSLLTILQNPISINVSTNGSPAVPVSITLIPGSPQANL